MDLHVFPIPIPPPASLSIPSLWALPLHQPWSSVPCIQPGLVICFTFEKFHLFQSIFAMCLVAQSCLTLWDSRDCNPPASSVRGISQARILEWVAISFSRGSSGPRDVSCIAGGFFTPEPWGKTLYNGYVTLKNLVCHRLFHIAYRGRHFKTMSFNKINHPKRFFFPSREWAWEILKALDARFLCNLEFHDAFF